MWPSKPEWPSESVQSFIGVTFAIVGNILISIALNVQKYAHLRLQDERDAQIETLDEVDMNEEGEDQTQDPSRDANLQSIPGDQDDSSDYQQNDAAYLKSKLWWLGIGLMIVGEFGNFIGALMRFISS